MQSLKIRIHWKIEEVFKVCNSGVFLKFYPVVLKLKLSVCEKQRISEHNFFCVPNDFYWTLCGYSAAGLV